MSECYTYGALQPVVPFLSFCFVCAVLSFPLILLCFSLCVALVCLVMRVVWLPIMLSLCFCINRVERVGVYMLLAHTSLFAHCALTVACLGHRLFYSYRWRLDDIVPRPLCFSQLGRWFRMYILSYTNRLYGVVDR